VIALAASRGLVFSSIVYHLFPSCRARFLDQGPGAAVPERARAWMQRQRARARPTTEGTRPMALKTAAIGNLVQINRVEFCNDRSSLTPFGHVVTIFAQCLTLVGSFSVLSFVRSTLADHFAALDHELCLRTSSEQLYPVVGKTSNGSRSPYSQDLSYPCTARTQATPASAVCLNGTISSRHCVLAL
jgi:hypothetical protein